MILIVGASVNLFHRVYTHSMLREFTLAVALSAATASAHNAPELVTTETRDRIDTLHLYRETQGDMWNGIGLDETKLEHVTTRTLALDYTRGEYIPQDRGQLPDPVYNHLNRKWEILYCDRQGNIRKLQATTRNEVHRTYQQHYDYMSSF
jgi:hypothetical protein